MKHYGCLLIVAMAVLTNCGCSSLVEFEHLSTPGNPAVPVGTSFTPGDVVTDEDADVEIRVVPFYWSNTQPSPSGFVRLVQDGQSGGTGNEMHCNNASLGITASMTQTIDKLELKFGEYGGNINLHVNSILHNYENFDDIPASQIAPVHLSVSTYPKGVLTLTGPIEPFTIDGYPGVGFLAVIGGQELWIDDIEIRE